MSAAASPGRSSAWSQCAVPFPRLEGWRVVAELHHDERGTRVPVVPGEELPRGDWQDASPRCDHCGLRRRRRTTVFLRHRSGDVAQVGTACLEDFTGQRDPLASISLRRAIEEASGGAASDEPAEPTLGDFLAAVATEAREHGFVAKADASDPGETTAERAARRLADGGEVTESDRELGHEVERWVRYELARKRGPSPYEARLVSVFRRSDRVGERDRAMVASAWPAFDRARERAVRHEHVGEVGDGGSRGERRTDTSLRSRLALGAGVLARAAGQQGRNLAWFAVGSRLEEGRRYRLRGRVRRHGSFRGEAVTVLERCRVVDR